MFSNQIQYLPSTKHAKERGELEAKGPSALVTQTAKDEAEARAEAKRIVMERLHSAETQVDLRKALSKATKAVKAKSCDLDAEELDSIVEAHGRDPRCLRLSSRWNSTMEDTYLDLLSEVCPYRIQLFRAYIARAAGLRNADGRYSKSDPYVRVMLGDRTMTGDKTSCRELCRTTVVRNTLDPEWQEMIESRVDTKVDWADASLGFEVYDWDFGDDEADDLLGVAAIRTEGIATLFGNGQLRDEMVENERIERLRRRNVVGIEQEEKEWAEKANAAGEAEGREGLLLEAELKDEYELLEEDVKRLVEEENEKARLQEIARKKEEERRVSSPSRRVTRKKTLAKRIVSKVRKNARATGKIWLVASISESVIAKEARREAAQKQYLLSTPPHLWPNLVTFDASQNQLITLPRSIRAWTKLRTLNMGANLLSELPEELGKLQALEFCSFADCQLVSLPQSIGQLSRLSLLRLDRNKLTSIPETVYNLTQLTQLNITGNPCLPVPGIKLWTYGDPILRFKNTKEKLDKVEPHPIMHMEAGIASTAGIKFDSILCRDFFSTSQGCRHGEQCMFSHVPPPLPEIPFQREKEEMSKKDARLGLKPVRGTSADMYGLEFEEYEALFKAFAEDDKEAVTDLQ
eukprot:g3931.t1